MWKPVSGHRHQANDCTRAIVNLHWRRLSSQIGLDPPRMCSGDSNLLTRQGLGLNKRPVSRGRPVEATEARADAVDMRVHEEAEPDGQRRLVGLVTQAE